MDFQIKIKNLKFILNVSPHVPKLVFIDPKRYRQVLFNLISNAIKFTFKGRITVTVTF